MNPKLVFDEKHEQLVYVIINRLVGRPLLLPVGGVQVIVCVDNTVLGPALGGTRMLQYASAEDARIDAIRLGRGMTYKMAMLWPDYKVGGGKGVIAVFVGELEDYKSPELFQAYGRIIQSLGGRFITGEDMNVTVNDVEAIRSVTKFVVGESREHGGSDDPGEFTAQGCIAAMRAAFRYKFGSESFRGRRLVIQGVGDVGWPLARIARDLGAHLVVCDARSERAERARTELKAEIVADLDAIYSMRGDVFVPCATGGILNDETILQLQCPVVVGSANNQLADPARHGQMLDDRGIGYGPDFVVNAGGATAVADELSPGGFSPERVRTNIGKIYERTRWNLEEAAHQKRPPHDVAVEMCEKRIALVRQANELGRHS